MNAFEMWILEITPVEIVSYIGRSARNWIWEQGHFGKNNNSSG